MGKVVYLNNQVTKEFMEKNNITSEKANRKNQNKVVELNVEKKARKKTSKKKAPVSSNNDYNGPDAG